MRRACKDTAVVCDGNAALLSFGYDFCSEHEWGIKGIQRAFGVSGDKADLTVGRYAVTEVGPLYLVEPPKPRDKEKRVYIVGGIENFCGETPEQFCERHRGYDEGKPAAWWDERGFLFSVPADFGRIKTFRAVYEAVRAKDALIYLCGSSNPFGGSGLVIARRSTIEREHIDKMEASFRDGKALRDAADATGIVSRVDAWGKAKSAGSRFINIPYFALSPKWMFEDRKASSKHPVIFWLNPYDQQNNNYGWFTVEELDQWIAGNGPIPMKAKVA